jgi:MFS family permease
MMHNLHLRGTNVVLVPQPSNDPNDPLRWPTWKKYIAFLNVCVFAGMITGFISGFSPALYLLSLEFKKDLSGTSGLITWPLLVSGLGVSLVHVKQMLFTKEAEQNFFWVPTGEYFGKRPVFVIASLILFCSIIGSAVSTSFEGLLASRVLAAFGGSSTEALGAAMVNVCHLLSHLDAITMKS